MSRIENIPGLLPWVPHSRTSCSDENPSNGILSYYRCLRCVLLDVQDLRIWPEGLEIEVSLTSRPLAEDEL